MRDYPLVRKLGVPMRQNRWLGYEYEMIVLAEDLERVLSEAMILYRSDTMDGAKFSYTECDDSTHTARLLLIEPIQKDTAESLLREIIADHEMLCKVGGRRAEWPLVTRARKLLRMKEGEG